MTRPDPTRGWTRPVVNSGCRSAVFMAAVLTIVCKPPQVGRYELYQLAAEVLQDCEKLVSQTSRCVVVALSRILKLDKSISCVDWVGLTISAID